MLGRRHLAGRARLVIPGVAAATVGLALQLTGWWGLVGVFRPHPRRSYEDLWVLTTAAHCAASDPHWTPASASCDPWGRAYNYPAVWARTFALLGIDGSDTWWLGTLLIGIFSVALVGLSFLTLRKAPTGAVGLLTLSAISPPVLLAMERGNIDLFVWPWVFVGLWLMCSSRWASAAAVVAGAAYLKIFPLGAVTGAFAHRTQPRRFVLLTAAASLAALGLEAGQLAHIRQTTPQAPSASWGVAVIPLANTGAARLPVSPYVTGLVLLCLGSLIGLLALRLFHRSELVRTFERAGAAIAGDHRSAVVVSAGLGLTVLIYSLGTNADYRLVVVTILVAGLARCWADPVCRRTATALVALQFASYPLGRAHEMLGDLVWMAMMPGLVVLACWLWLPSVRAWVTRPDEPEDVRVLAEVV